MYFTKKLLIVKVEGLENSAIKYFPFLVISRKAYSKVNFSKEWYNILKYIIQSIKNFDYFYIHI